MPNKFLAFHGNRSEYDITETLPDSDATPVHAIADRAHNSSVVPQHEVSYGNVSPGAIHVSGIATYFPHNDNNVPTELIFGNSNGFPGLGVIAAGHTETLIVIPEGNSMIADVDVSFVKATSANVAMTTNVTRPGTSGVWYRAPLEEPFSTGTLDRYIRATYHMDFPGDGNGQWIGTLWSAQGTSGNVLSDRVWGPYIMPMDGTIRALHTYTNGGNTFTVPASRTYTLYKNQVATDLVFTITRNEYIEEVRSDVPVVAGDRIEVKAGDTSDEWVTVNVLFEAA